MEEKLALGFDWFDIPEPISGLDEALDLFVRSWEMV